MRPTINLVTKPKRTPSKIPKPNCFTKKIKASVKEVAFMEAKAIIVVVSKIAIGSLVADSICKVLETLLFKVTFLSLPNKENTAAASVDPTIQPNNKAWIMDTSKIK